MNVPDKEAARELFLYIENVEILYIKLNLIRKDVEKKKRSKNKYNLLNEKEKLANLVNVAAKSYAKEHLSHRSEWDQVFTFQTRVLTRKLLEKEIGMQ